MKIKECSEPHLGSYDMRIDTTGMPESLATKLNSHICNKVEHKAVLLLKVFQKNLCLT